MISSILIVIVLCCVIWSLYQRNKKLLHYNQKIDFLEQKALLLKEIKIKKDQRWEEAKKSSAQYLCQKIEALPLLNIESQRVQSLLRQYPNNRILQDRLAFLQNDKNRIQFIQSQESIGSGFSETHFNFKNPVQIDESDLRKILYSIEGNDPISKETKPLLMFKKFNLQKVLEDSGEMVYSLQTEIIKRTPCTP